MEDYILLYIDNDYIIPVIDTVAGDLHQYKSKTDSRLWLYFREDLDTTDVLFGQDNYRAARLNKAGYFGDYWNRLEKDDNVTIHGTSIPYVELVKVSGILSSIIKWYESTTQKLAINIPAICIFSDSISNESRKIFLNFLAKEKFSIRSYSKNFNSLVAAYCDKRISRGFGSRMIFVSASGNEVQLSTLIFDDNSYTDCREPLKIMYDGENPILMALVKHVVDKNNRDNGFLRQQQIEEEYIYQMQFAPNWFAKAKDVDEEGSFLIDYHLSIDQEIKYSLNVSKSFIVNKQKELSRPITDKIEIYCTQNNLADVSQYVYLGDIFASEEMYRICSKFAPQKSSYISVSHYPEILHLFLKMYELPSEQLSNFDEVMESCVAAREAANVWVANSDMINDILRRSKQLSKEFNEYINKFADSLKVLFKSIDVALLTSDFTLANSFVDEFKDKNHYLKNYILQNITPLINEDQCNINNYEKVAAYQSAKNVINELTRNINSILGANEVYDKASKSIEEKLELIAMYKDHYHIYRKKRSEFDNATTLLEKRQLLEEMKGITGEQLPEDVKDVEPVVGTIDYRIESEKKFLGLKKEESLIIDITIGETPLPYACLLLISDKTIVSFDRTLPNFPIEKGSVGTVSCTFKLPIANFSKAAKLIVRIMIDTEKEELVDISKISFNNLYIQVK